MKYLLDTCAISEVMRPRPNPRLLDWVNQQHPHALFLSVLTLGEITKGILLMPGGAKRMRLQSWVENELKPEFHERWLDVDQEVAERWAIISFESHRRGRPMPTTDGLISAIALVHGMTIVTRNSKDFEPSGALILNPWE